MPKKTLSVYADPFAALDHEGRPAHACPTDPKHTPGMRRWVGARLGEATRLLDLDEDEHESVQCGFHEHPQDTVFEFDDGPIELPQTPYYLERIRHGELIAADEKTARKAGAPWSDPKARLAASRAAAIKRWQDDNEGDLPPFAVDAPKAAVAKLTSEASAPASPARSTSAAKE